MKKAIILFLTNFFILTLILLGKPAKAQTTAITGQFLYGLQLYVLPNKQTTPDYSTAIYSSTIDENDFITSGLYENWLQPRLPDGINGYIYLVDISHTISNVYIGGGYLEQGQTLSYPYEPKIEIKRYNLDYNLISVFFLQPVNKIYFDSYGGNMEYIVYYDSNDGQTPRIKLIDATTNENDYNRVKLAINGYDTGYNAGYSIGYNNGQVNGYDNGYQDGQTNGYSAGYNAGQYDFYNEYYQQIYDDGYNAGLADRQIGVNTVVSFNQIVSQAYNVSNSDATFTAYQDETRIYGVLNAANNTDNIINLSNIFDISPRLIQYHIYAWQGLTSASDITYRCGFYPLYTSSIYRYNLNSFSGIFTYSYYDANTKLQLQIMPHSTLVNVLIEFQLFDLTEIYGSGQEPTNYETFKNDFPSDYYPYSVDKLININYENGYITGKNDGFAIGYDDGKSYQATQQLTSDGWIKNIFTGIGSFLAIEIIPNVSIGLIVGIPFIISVAWFVIKMARGGGNT